jgi:hypothetical protein
LALSSITSVTTRASILMWMSDPRSVHVIEYCEDPPPILAAYISQIYQVITKVKNLATCVNVC